MLYRADELIRFATLLLEAGGLDAAPAQVVSETLVEGDLLGHDTHGLALLGPYLAELSAGRMTDSGEARVISERGAALLWDGRRLPGPWLVRRGVETLIPIARREGTANLVIRRSHHIACLAAYLAFATEAGFLMILTSSDPAAHSVAPHGGTRAIVTPNPIAVGIPTSGDPILIDISTSSATNGMSARLFREGGTFEDACLIDANGTATRDPAVLFADPPGTILPLGGLNAGHKGFGLTLLVEALTGGLAGLGRADPAEGWGASVFLALFDPAAYGGAEAFARQMDALVVASRENPARPGFDRVRMPGERGLAKKRDQLAKGVSLRDDLAKALAQQAARFQIAAPKPI